jgi:hypothetical protein
MAPKKKEEVKERPILGRFRSNLKVCRAMVADFLRFQHERCSKGT